MNPKLLTALAVVAVCGAVVVLVQDRRPLIQAPLAPPPAAVRVLPVVNPMSVAAVLPPDSVAGAALVKTDPVPPNYTGRHMALFEAHWQGLDGRLMTRELSKKLGWPVGTTGLLVGEVTLNAASSGLRAGDVVVRVGDVPIQTVADFQAATKVVMNRGEAAVTVLRKASNAPGVFRTLTMVVRGDDVLGFAQVEGAPQILPGDPRPHAYRGPCTECHSIGEGMELTPDPDLITLPTPVIARDVAARGAAPHENRGVCEACHVIQ
jgi:Magnetochrome domain